MWIPAEIISQQTLVKLLANSSRFSLGVVLATFKSPSWLQLLYLHAKWFLWVGLSLAGERSVRPCLLRIVDH